MFGFRLTRDRELIEAIKTVEELRKVNAILKINVATKQGKAELCLDYSLEGYECRELNIHRGSLISSILSLYKLKIK